MSSNKTEEEMLSAGQPAGEAAGSGKTAIVREKTRWRVIRFLMYFFMFFFVLAGRSAQWVTEEWGDLTLAEVVFTLTQPLEGTDSGLIKTYICTRLCRLSSFSPSCGLSTICS